MTENKGDLISREALKANMKKAEEQADTFEMLVEFYEQIIDNAPTVCGNNPKWCESCVSKGKCASTRPQDDLISRDCSTCARYSDFQKEIPDECKGCKHNYFSNYKEKERGADMRGANNG